MKTSTKRGFRKTHRWGAILIALPFLIVLITGIILQVKKEVAWVQPPSMKGISQVPEITFQEILNIVSEVPEAEIDDWDDVDRLDVRPDKGIVKVRAKNNWEIQLDTQTGEVLQVAFRRSDIIESIHDGSWFHDRAKLWIFLPSAMVVLLLWVTGMYLYFLPKIQQRKNRKWRADNDINLPN